MTHDWLAGPIPKLKPTYAAVSENYIAKEKRIGDPTRLILVDEADRLKIVCLEQMRAIFDAGGIGLVLIGMPGIEKRMARYAQFYSRIGFVHEFRPLNISEMRRLLTKGWSPPGVSVPALDSEAVTSVIRITGGNFRLFERLLTQIERITEINNLTQVSKEAVEAARESLVIGSDVNGFNGCRINLRFCGSWFCVIEIGCFHGTKCCKSRLRIYAAETASTF